MIGAIKKPRTSAGPRSIAIANTRSLRLQVATVLP